MCRYIYEKPPALPVDTYLAMAWSNKVDIFSGKQSMALSLIVCLLVGCAHANKDEPLTEGRAVTMQPPIRVIIYLSQSPAADGKQLATVISEACRCHPVFFRQYNSNALIYEIGLPQNHTFASFEKALRAGGAPLGIQAVEQDVLMQHQQ